MNVFISSNRNHEFLCFADGLECNEKNWNYSQKTGIETSHYIVEKTGPVKIIFIEKNNNRIFRVLINLFTVYGAIYHSDFLSVKHNKSKLEMLINSESLDDTIEIKQSAENVPPFEIKASCSCEVFYNGHFKGSARKQIKNISVK